MTSFRFRGDVYDVITASFDFWQISL